MNPPPRSGRAFLSTVARIVAGVLLLPVLPFLSALVWRAERFVVGIGALLTVAGYLVFFLHAIGWGAVGVAAASAWCLGGSVVNGWRRRSEPAVR